MKLITLAQCFGNVFIGKIFINLEIKLTTPLELQPQNVIFAIVNNN